MTPQLNETLDRIAAGARANFRAAVAGARGRGHKAARRVAETRRPLEALAGVGLKLSAVSHRTTDRVLKQNTQLAVNQLDAVATRLESAATATCLRDLVKKQIALTPEQFARLRSDARASLSIVAEGGSEAGSVLKSAVNGLGARKATRTTAARKATKTAAARKPRKKAVRKTPATKTRATASKAAAKRAPRKKKAAAATPATTSAS